MTPTQKDTDWTVKFSPKADKQRAKLPKRIDDRLAFLVMELITEGPVQPEWTNYSKLQGKKGEYHHCHLNTGRPTYVVVWQVIEHQVRVMEVRYTGPHGSVNYGGFK